MHQRKFINLSSFNRSLNTSVILEDEDHKFELNNIGFTLPVMVSEALTSIDRSLNSSVSVQFYECGWVCLIVGRRLFVWRHAAASVKNLQCKELTLPVSDLTHRAKLVCLVTIGSGSGGGSSIMDHHTLVTPTAVGCLAASPEGVLRYWPRLTNAEVFVDSSTELRGEECVHLLPCYFADTYALVTRSSTVMLVTCGARHEAGLSCRALRSDAGFLKGIGRRVSFFFGGNMNATSCNLPLQAALTRPLSATSSTTIDSSDVGDCGGELLLSCGSQLQRWEIYLDHERKDIDINIDRMLREELSKLCSVNLFDPESDLQIWDMQSTQKKNVVILGEMTAADCAARNFLAIIDVDKLEITNIATFIANGVAPTGEQAGMASLYLPTASNDEMKSSDCVASLAYLVWPFGVAVVELRSGSRASRVDLSVVGERLLGVRATSTGLMLFTRRNGLLELRPHAVDDDSSSFFRSPAALPLSRCVVRNPQNTTSCNNKSGGVGLQSMFDLDTTSAFSNISSQSGAVAVSAASGSASDVQHLRVEGDKQSVKETLLSSFQLYSHGNQRAAISQVTRLFEQSQDQFINNLLLLADEILDDSPASDPRWAETCKKTAAASSSSTSTCSLSLLATSYDSVLIGHQLSNKEHALQNFFKFLRQANLWTQLQTTSVSLADGHDYSASSVLLLRGERLAAIRGLRDAQTQNSLTLELVIRELTTNAQMPRHTPASLTQNDLFYRLVSSVDDALTKLASSAEMNAMSDAPLSDISNSLESIANLVLGALREAAMWRRSHNDLSSHEGSSSNNTTHTVSLVGSGAPVGLRDCLVKVIEALTRHLAQHQGEIGQRGRLLSLIIEAIDLVLAALTAQHSHAVTCRPEHAFTHFLAEQLDAVKKRLISPLVNSLNESERALQLAERYQEWDLLVRVCDATANHERLQRYMRQFASAGFAQFLFQWYLQEGKRGRLLSTQLGHQQQARLAEFLESDDTRSLLWLQHINTGHMSRAAEALRRLAVEERHILARKRTLLSLSKLAFLAAVGQEQQEHEHENHLNAINGELEIVRIQSTLPSSLLDALGLDADVLPVYTPQEMLYLFANELNPERGPLHLKQALDLLHYVCADVEQLEEMRQFVWARAILQDDWSSPRDVQADDPLYELRDTCFVQLVNLCHMDGMELRTMLPRLEDLVSSMELNELRNNTTFQYLMHAAYEGIEQLYLDQQVAH